MALALASVLPKLQIEWSSPLVFSAGTRQFQMPFRQNLDGTLALDGSLKLLCHDLRSFLHHAVRRCVAARDLYFVQGLEDGWLENALVKSSTYAMRHVAGGTCLLSGAHWTLGRIMPQATAVAICARDAVRNRSRLDTGFGDALVMQASRIGYNLN